MALGLFRRNGAIREEEDIEPAENYVEVNVMDSDEKRLGNLAIKIERLEEFADTERVLRSVRDGNIIFLKIKGLKEKDIGELKRAVDKLTRVQDALPHIECGNVMLPSDAPWVSDFIAECEAFTADNSHAHDDQIDPMCDAIKTLLQSNSAAEKWARMI